MLPDNAQPNFEQSFSKYKLQADINVVPYIDVMLVLLVVFMITAPLMTQGVKVDLPEATAQPMQANQDTIVITVTQDNAYFLNIGGTVDKAKSKAELLTILDALGATARDQQVFVEGDTSLPYGQVIELMGFLQQSGINRVGLVTAPALSDKLKK